MPIDDANGLQYGSGDFYEHILNNYFRGAVADTVINPNTLSSRLDRDGERVEGKNIVFPTHVGRNHGVSAIGPDGELPDPDSQQYDSFAFPIRSVYGRIKFDGLSMDASGSDVASWLRAVLSEVQGLSRDIARQKQRMMHGDGSGAIAQVRTTITASQSTINVSCYSGLPNSNTTDMPDGRPTKFLKKGMRIAVVHDGGGGAPTTNPLIAYVGKITAILDDGDNGDLSAQIQVSPNIDGSSTNIAAGAFIVTAANTALTLASPEDLKSTGYHTEPQGIGGIIQDSNPDDGVSGFQGVDASAADNDWNRSHVITMQAGAGTAALTRAKMDETFTTVIEKGDCVPTAIYGNFGFVREYAASMIDTGATDGRRRFVNTMELDDGYSGLSYTNVPIFADRDTRECAAYFLDETDLKVGVMTEPKWMDMDGSIYSRLDNKDAYQSAMYCRDTLFSEVRDRHALLTRITEA